MSTSAVGAALGLVAACGLLMVFSRLVALKAPSLLERVAPFVPMTEGTRSVLQPTPGLGQILVSAVRPALRLDWLGGGIQRRLELAGDVGVSEFRLMQLTAIGLGSGMGVLVGLFGVTSGASPVCLPLLLGVGAIAGAVLANQLLTVRIQRRQRLLGQQLPVVAELLAFAVAAGEAPAQAMERVCRSLDGELAGEFESSLAEVRGGRPLDLALRSMATRCGHRDVERFLDACVVAMERGSPLAEVLRAQAADARAAQRRALMESASRKEVAMLVPVVFLILPIVVLVAVFPGLQGLQLVIH